MKLIWQILFATIVGAILSFFAALLYLWILEKNNLPPFYHGMIKLNFFETIIIGMTPLLLLIKKRSITTFKFKLLGYLYIGVCTCFGWVIGIYEQTTISMANDPNSILFLGKVGGIEWFTVQKYFLIGFLFGVLSLLLINNIPSENKKPN